MRKGSHLTPEQKRRVSLGQIRAWEKRLNREVPEAVRERQSESAKAKWARLLEARIALEKLGL